MKSILTEEAYREVLDRIDTLDEKSKGQWGKMTVAQMLSHCQNPLLVALGQKQLRKPNFIMKLVYRSFKSAMYNDTPWKKNIKTPAEYRVDSEKEFEVEKSRLIKLIDAFYLLKDREVWDPHPAFGHFSKEQWGMMQYKHLDHHLKQFKV